MSLNMHVTQYVLSQHNIILQALRFDWLCNNNQNTT